MRIYTESLWEEYQKINSKAKRILERREQNSNSEPVNSKNMFKELNSGRKLSRYILEAPSGRAVKTVERLAGISIGKDADSVLYHESKHAGDAELKKRHEIKRALGIGATIGATTASYIGFDALASYIMRNEGDLSLFTYVTSGCFGIIGANFIYYWLIDSAEKRANKFAKELSNSSAPRLIKIMPKEDIGQNIEARTQAPKQSATPEV